MSKISAMMDIGKQSMMNSQAALQTTSHNIANKSTEGYSRQRVESVSNTPIGSGKVRIGMGVRTMGVTRTNNPHLEKQILTEGAELGFSQSRSNALSRVEEVYNEQINKGLNKYMADFFNSFRELSLSPENLANRTLVRETSANLAKDFGRVSSQLKGIQGDLEAQIKAQVYDVNKMTNEIAHLNEKVQMVEITGATANDERDRRDQLLKDLSEKINIRWAEGDAGMVTVTAGTSALVVSGHDNYDLIAQNIPTKEKRQGDQLRVFFEIREGLTPVDVTDQIKGGAIGAALQVRDKDIEKHLDDIDEMARSFSSRVNGVHKQGYNSYAEKGLNLFEIEGDGFDAAAKISVSKAIQADVSKIATAATVNSPGDNRIANVIADLQYKNTMRSGRSSFDQFYNGLVGKVGVAADQANNRLESQGSIVRQLKNLRDSISGVSLDEETTKMIEFQKTFDASATLIRTADEMMATVLSLKR